MAEEYNHSCRYILFDEEGRPELDSAGKENLKANFEDMDNTVLNGSGSSNAVFNVSTAGINRGYLTPLSSPSLNMGYSDPDKPSPGQSDVECIDIQINSREGPEYGAPVEDTYGAPADEGYGAPADEGYGAPADQGYGAPEPSYGGEPIKILKLTGLDDQDGPVEGFNYMYATANK